MIKHNGPTSSIIEQLSAYVSRGVEAEIPTEVINKTKLHILDTLSAIVSGSKLKPGLLAIKYISQQGGVREAQVIGSPIVTSAINAALANGIMAHADETDDSHSRSGIHPGCAIIPAALAISQKRGMDGISFLKAVVVGYDIGCRITQVLGVHNLRRTLRSPHSIGGTFGAAAAAATLAQLNETQTSYALSYAAQQASGVTYWINDDEHVEKAFVFGGMSARNGVTAATLMQSGFTGVRDPFSGERNFFKSFSTPIEPQLLVDRLGSHYEIMITNIKKYPVGSPIQAPLKALLNLIGKFGLTFSDVESITARLEDLSAVTTVSDRSMPDINLKYILAVTLLDGGLTFAAAHSYERMNDPAVLALKKRITIVEDPELAASKIRRQGIVEVTTRDGALLKEHVVSVQGTAENPMDVEEVESKCKDLLIPVLGKDRSLELISRIFNLEQLTNVRDLNPLLSVP